MSVKLLQQLYANFTKPLRAERVNLPLQTFTRSGKFTQTLILRKSPFSCCDSINISGVHGFVSLTVINKQIKTFTSKQVGMPETTNL